MAIKIKGLKELKRKLGKQGEAKVTQIISDEMEAAAYDVQGEAMNRAPVDTGITRAGISVEGKDLRWIVYTVAEYAGYQEFGTKTLVDVPPEMKEQADKFRSGKGDYKEFKKQIAAWMNRKGIPKEAIFPIMAKIMKIGVKPHPFMYPAFKNKTKDIGKNIDAAIQAELNKI